MLAQWKGDLVGRMHLHRVTITQLSQEMGVTREYLSMVLNDRRDPGGMEKRMNDALDSLIEKQKAAEGEADG